MNSYVVQLGNIYVKTGSDSGPLQFTRDLREAAVYRISEELKTAHILADSLGGTVSLITEGDNPAIVGVQARVDILMPDNEESWFDKYLPYILNCVGNTESMIGHFQRWRVATGKPGYVMSARLGLPCGLTVIACEAPADAPSQSGCAFALVLLGELTPEQGQRWRDLPYGILLTTGRRILIPSLRVTSRPAIEVVSTETEGSVSIKDTPERRALLAKYEQECAVAFDAQKKDTTGVRTMSLS